MAKSIPVQKTSLSFHYAWVVMAVIGLVLLSSAGIRATVQVLVTPLEHEFGWMRADISFAAAVSILWFGLGGPVAGGLITRFGIRRVIAAGLVLIAAGLTALLWLTELWELYLYWGLVVGVGTGMLANVVGATVAQRWFVKHRGSVMGVFGASSAAGQMIFLPAMISLNTSEGWRGAVLVAGVIMAALLIPVLLFVREFPADIHALPLGAEDAAGWTGTETTSPDTPLRAALRTRTFWLLGASYFVCGYTSTGLIGTHLLPHALDHGFASDVAGEAIALMGIMNVAGGLVSGWLSDRIDNRKLLAFFYGFRGLSLALLPAVNDVGGLLVFAIIYGADAMATMPPTVNVIAKRYGTGSVGIIYGWIFFLHMVGGAVAAYAAGALRDWLGDYSVAFISAAALSVAAALLVHGIERPSRPLPLVLSDVEAR